ncbi:MAG: MlaD family protein [Planctomycetota bacterium]
MDENVMKLRVGIFVLLAIVILGILILANSEGWVSQYDIYIKPERAPGVTVGTPVRKNGILIGRVKGVSTDDDEGLVVLRLGIDSKAKVYENEICEIGTESLLGDAKIEFLPLSKAERGAEVTPDYTMTTVAIEKNPMEIATDFSAGFDELKPQLRETLTGIQDAGKEVGIAGREIGDLSRQIKNSFQDKEGEFNQLVRDLRQFTQKGQRAVDNFNLIFEDIKSVVGDPEVKQQFKNAITEIPKIFEEIRVLVEDTGTAVQNFGELPGKVDKTLANVEVFSESLKENGPQILKRVNTSLENVDKFVNELKGVSELLERFKNADGTIVKLFEEDDLYQTVLDAVANIKKETVRIGPLMDDLRLFADAIARDPGSLGLRGSLDRRPGKTGYKGNAGRDGMLR